MFKYIINGEEVTFNDIISRDAALAEASEKGYTVQAVEISSAPESAFSQVISGEVPEVEEDFTQDPVESADAVSETVAQNDTVLPLGNGSLGFQPIPLGDGTMPDVSGSVPFSIDGKEVTEEEYKEYEKTFAPEPKFITDPIQIGNIQGEIDQIETSLQGFGFSQSDQGKEALKRQQYLQNQLDSIVKMHCTGAAEILNTNLKELGLTI